jgi:hypothetical protein
MKRRIVVSLLSFAFTLSGSPRLGAQVSAPAPILGAVPSQNINMVSGTQFPGGDPYLQRQNESSMAVSSRNPQHLLAGANDYRSVDIPFPPDQGKETGDAWLGVFTSIDGGQTWSSTLLPGYPQDTSATGTASPLHQFQAATDPTVRAGTHGLFYYSGLVFDRGTQAPSGVFVATFQDQNNKANGAGAIQDPKDTSQKGHPSGNPFLYLNATLIDTGTSGQFNDKPWIAVDVPRPGRTATCKVNGKTIQSGYVYVFYTVFLGDGSSPHSQIRETTSKDCGVTWSKYQKLSQSFPLDQGTVATIDPGTGTVYVVWRQISSNGGPDAILYSYSTDGGNSFLAGTAYTFPAGQSFDESSDGGTFREADLPTATVDGSGRVWVAFSQRNVGPLGSSRIMITTLARGSQTWTPAFVADPTAAQMPGHQFMPALEFAYGKLMLSFFDNRDDNTKGILQCPANQICAKTSDLVEVRVPIPGSDLAAGNLSRVFSPTISDTGMKIRHTIDVRGALVDPSQFQANSNPPFAFPTARISQYTYGSRPGSKTIEQMKFNPPNFPMFAKGTRPFIGDYIDVTALKMLAVPGPNNTTTWMFNTKPSNAAVFHTTWTDNRDVRPPPVVCKNGTCTQDWTQYTPVASTGGSSSYDPTQQKPACVPGQAGSRNQNVYTARVTQGLLVGVKENTKPLVSPNNMPVQRAFSVFARNTTNNTAFYRFTVNPLSPQNLCTTDSSTTASFSQTIPPAGFSCVNSVDVIALPSSTVSRSLFVNSTQKYPSVTVTIAQIDKIGGNVIGAQNGGLQSTTAINPDSTNPDITNPDITNPDITNPDITNPDITNPDIINFEVYDPTVTNPDITNPDITNPDITNPDITNPDITNPDITNPDINNMVVTNPDITNPDITNPDITNPDITNPDITNPDITNPDITNLSAGGINDVTFKLTNKGNTSVSYSAKEFAKQAGVQCSPLGATKCQLIVRKTYPTPLANGCTLTVETQNIPISNVPNPAFTTGSVTPDNGSDNPNVQPDPTVSVGPGEGVRVTLRVFGSIDPPQPGTSPVKTIGVAGGADTGQQTPAASLTITRTNLPVAVVGTDYQANSGASSKLTSVGGIGSTTWSFTAGSLPPNIMLNSSSGQLSGQVADNPGAFGLTFKAADSSTGFNGQTRTPSIDLQNLTIDVNKFSITKITAGNTNIAKTIYLKSGDSATVTVTVSNQGPAIATNVVPVIQPHMVVDGTQTDRTPPQIVCQPVANPSSANLQGNTTQDFSFSCNAGGGNGEVTFTATATGQYVNSAATVPAAAITTATTDVSQDQLVIDNVPPTLAFSAANPPANAAGWNNTSVSFAYMTADNLSGVASNLPGSPVVINVEGTGLTRTVVVTDKSGNSASFTTSPALNIDFTAPQLTVAGSTLNGAYQAGTWTNQSVTVVFTCNDTFSQLANSGVVSPTYPAVTNVPGQGAQVTHSQNSPASASTTVVLTAKTAGTTLTATCSDVAANPTNPATGLSFGPIMIDKTPPSIGIVTPAPGQTFILNSQITPVFACNDGGGGDVVTACTPTPATSPYTATPVGAGTFTVNATDQATNMVTASTNYTVIYNFTGFQTPLQPAGPTSAPTNSGAFTPGNQILVQWQLQDANAKFIADPAALTSVQAYPNSVCTGAPDGGAVPLFQNGGAVAPSTFALNGNVYTLTWNTTGLAASCYNIVVTLNDMTQHATIVNLVTTGTATQFADGVFNNANWSSAKVFDTTPSAGATFTAAQAASGGNPGQYRQVNMTFGQGTIIVGHLNPLAVYTPATQGAIGSISYSYDVREFNPPFAGAAVNYALLLLQNGTYYVPDPTDTFSNTDNWQNVGNTNLTATQFSGLYQGTLQLPGAGPIHPDFSANGAPITFGYFSANTNTGVPPITTSSGIDNWSVNVSPFMNVSGSNITGFYSVTGAFSSAPTDLSTTTISALVPNGMGGFTTIAGAGKADGTFSIPSVPAGYYWLQLGNQWLWTSEAIIDAGSTSEGRANAIHANTTVNFAVSGMSPWQSSDSLEYWTPNVYEVDSDIGAAPATGATSYNDSVPLQGLIDTSQGDQFFLMHLGASNSGPYTIGALEDIFSPSGPIMETANSTNNFSGSFTQLAQNSVVDLAVNASQFAQFTTVAGPGATLDFATFSVHITTPSQELLFGNADPTLFELFRTDSGGISSDFNLGNTQYGDPFPANYVRYYSYQQDFRFQFTSPGATLPNVGFVSTSVITLTPPNAMAPISPVVGPVSSVAINSTPFTQNMSSVGTTPTISWQAPTVGSVTDYRVVIFQLGVNASGRSTATRLAVLHTTATSLQIPPGILTTGSSYLLDINSDYRAGEDGQANLFKTKFPYGVSTIVTYQLTP